MQPLAFVVFGNTDRHWFFFLMVDMTQQAVFRRPTPLSVGTAVRFADYSVFTIAFILIVVFPTQLQVLKILLLLFYIPLRMAHLHSQSRLRFDTYNFVIPYFFVAVGVFFCLLGFLQNAPGAVRVSTVHVAYPLLFGFLAGTADFSEAKKLVKLLSALVSVASILILLILVLAVLGMSPPPLFEDSVVDLQHGYSKLSFPLLAILNFSTPFIVASFAFRKSIRFPLFYYVIFAITVLDAIVCGRRGTWLVLAFSLLFLLFIGRLRFGSFLALILFAGAGVGLAFYLVGLNFDYLVWYLEAGFRFTSMADRGSAVVRGQQLVALMNGFMDAPLLGHGLGSTAARYGSVRSHEMPWAYELSYAYSLFSTGILGTLIYGSGIGWILLQLRRASRDPAVARFGIPLIAGMLGFLLAHATNPYLGKFDYMFVIFLPYAFVTAYIREKNIHPHTAVEQPPPIKS